MSTKIDSSLIATGRPLLDRLKAKSGNSVETVSTGAIPASGDDTVKITGDAMKMQHLEKSLAGSPSFDAKRVDSIRAAIAENRYRIDPQVIASRLTSSDASLG